MNASDLPDMHSCPSAMARSLVSYMRSDEAVQQAVLEAFGKSPCLGRIGQMRERLNREEPPEKPFTAHEGYWPAETSRNADRANKVFLERLQSAYPERFAA